MPYWRMDNSMRLHIVTDTYPPDPNSLSFALASWVNCLQQAGIDVLVLRAGKSCSENENGMPSVSLSFSSDLRLGLPGKGKLKKLWTATRPDMLYVTTGSPLGISAIKAARDLNIPVVTALRPVLTDVFSQTLFSSWGKSTLKYFKKHFNKSELTLAPSEEVRKKLLDADFNQVEVLEDGVDCELFSPSKRDHSLRADWGVRKGTTVIGLSGPATNKALLPVIQLIHLLQEEGHDLMGVVLGDGADRDELAGMHTDLIFAPFHRSELQAGAYASLDILIHIDDSGIHTGELLKGMSSGILCIATSNTQSEKIITPGENGFLMKNENPVERKKIIESVLQNIAEQAPLQNKARESMTDHSWEKSTHSLLSHFEKILEKRRVEETTPALQESISQGIPSQTPLECETLFLSDIHLGTADSKATEATELLKHIRCKKIVLVGDIIDTWALKRGGVWKNRHTRFIRTLLKKMEKEDCEIIYIRGNHDEVLEHFIPLALGKLEIHKEYIHHARDGKTYLVTHGDGFDSISTNHKWLAVLGSIGYDFLLAFNRYYNKWRAWRGKEYFSLSKAIKSKVKSAVSYVGRYEEQLQCLAEHRKCQGIICGHIHSPADKIIGNIRYLNCGDWVESLSFVMETSEGDFQVCHYSDLSELVKESENDVKIRSQC